ncbi:MAG: MBL fold metallo-hydrolase [Chloroflexota bacterium]|nr:MBL fold metallo-hydrolase [Chloroflexota bacterium]
MTIEIQMLTMGIAVTNCYIIGDTATNAALVIDPVDQAPRIVQAAQDKGWTIKLILATHAHFDHVLASKELKDATGAPFYAHEDCKPWLDMLPDQGLRFIGQRFPEAAAVDRWLTSAQETLTLDSITLETLYTPGHAPGHISYWMPAQRIVFSGDALFQGSIGRTDLPGGDHATLMRSIFDMLVPLGDDAIVLSGHGGRTTIGHERKTNPFLLDWQS